MHLHTAMPASAWSQGVPAANLTPYDRDSQDPTPTSTPCAARAQSSSQPLFPGGPAPKCDGQKEPQPLCAAAPLYVHHCRAVSAHHAHCRGGHGSGLVGHIHSRVGPDGAAPRAEHTTGGPGGLRDSPDLITGCAASWRGCSRRKPSRPACGPRYAAWWGGTRQVCGQSSRKRSCRPAWLNSRCSHLSPVVACGAHAAHHRCQARRRRVHSGRSACGRQRPLSAKVCSRQVSARDAVVHTCASLDSTARWGHQTCTRKPHRHHNAARRRGRVMQTAPPPKDGSGTWPAGRAAEHGGRPRIEGRASCCARARTDTVASSACFWRTRTGLPTGRLGRVVVHLKGICLRLARMPRSRCGAGATSKESLGTALRPSSCTEVRSALPLPGSVPL